MGSGFKLGHVDYEVLVDIKQAAGNADLKFSGRGLGWRHTLVTHQYLGGSGGHVKRCQHPRRIHKMRSRRRLESWRKQGAKEDETKRKLGGYRSKNERRSEEQGSGK